MNKKYPGQENIIRKKFRRNDQTRKKIQSNKRKHFHAEKTGGTHQKKNTLSHIA